MYSLEALLAYLPSDRRDAIAAGRELPHRTNGAALCADLSGFTPLTEALVHDLGPRRGAEELALYLNRFYDALIAPVGAYGGSVVDFSGDAITCWFDADDGSRAIAAAQAMQVAMQSFATLQLSTGESIAIGVKIAVVSGEVRRFQVGDPNIQLLDTLAGASIDRLATLGHMARIGEILWDEPTAAPWPIAEWRSDPQTGQRAAILNLPVAALTPQHPAESLTLTEEQIRPWLLPAVFARLQGKQGEFLTELRPAVALFMRFDGLNYDDEQAGATLDVVVRAVQHILVEYDGTLLQLTIGDKGSYLYAAFGAPVAHEDDVTRAVNAALALRALPDLASVSIGLSRGVMRTGAYGSATRRIYGVLGDAVNLAARLMQHAAPGQILASENIWRGSLDFDWQEQPSFQAKGKQATVTPAALLGRVETDAFAGRAHLSAMPMIGRQDELLRVEEKLALARQGHGQIVSIVAEAGMGKSRLLAEVLQRADIACYSGECQSYGTNSAYLVWHAIWQALFGIADMAPAEQIETLEKVLSRLNPDFVLRMPLLGPVLNLSIPDNGLTSSMDAKMRKTLRESLLVDFLREQAAQRPLILMIEDVHWIDPVSVDLLEGIWRTIEMLPVLILLTHRPMDAVAGDFLLRLTNLTYATQISLNDLTVAEIGQLLAIRLAYFGFNGRIPPALVERIAARTQGNPFYAEELFSYLHDRGLDPCLDSAWEQADLPDSLHSLILSRIDQLSERQQITVKAASVIGRLFRAQWLYEYQPTLGAAQVLEDLQALRQLDFVAQDAPEPQLAYMFKHVITQEVAYESLAYATRASLHEQFAGYLEQAVGDDVHPRLDLLAYHYERSNNLPKKREYLCKAGEAAQNAFANEAAVSYLKRVLVLIPETNSAEQASLALRLGAILILLGRLGEAQAFLKQALRVYLENKDFDNVAAVYAMSAQIFWGLNDVAGTLAATQEGLSIVGNQPPGKGMADLLRWAAIAYVFNDKFDEATVLVNKAIDVSRNSHAHDALAHSLTTLGLIQERLGQPELAVTSYQQAIEIAEQYNLSSSNSRARNNLANILLLKGKLSEAAAQHEYMVVLCQKENIIFLKIWFLCQLGLLCIEMGKTREAVALLLQLEIDLKGTDGNIYREQYEEFLGTLRYYTGELNQAQEILTNLLTTTTNRQTILNVAFKKAAILQAQGIHSEAVTLMEKGIRESGIWGAAEYWYLLAGAYALVGNALGARQALAHADDVIDAQQPNFIQSIERLRVEINLDLLEADYAAAIEKYRNLVAYYYIAEYRWRYAQTLQDWAKAYLKTNQRDAAKGLLLQATAEFEAMEIQVAVTQIQQELIEIDSVN